MDPELECLASSSLLHSKQDASPKDCSNSAGEALSTSVPITMDDLRFGLARKLPRSFRAIADRDDPYRANLRRQAQDVLHLLIVERPDKEGGSPTSRRLKA